MWYDYMVRQHQLNRLHPLDPEMSEVNNKQMTLWVMCVVRPDEVKPKRLGSRPNVWERAQMLY